VNEPTPGRHGVQAIARAAAVLRAVEHAPGGLALGEIASAVELPKSTAHRIVGALITEELLTQGDDGQVRFGGAISRLASAGREALADRLQPILVDLRRELDETVDLAVLDGTAVRFIDQVAAPRRLRAVSSVGESFPLHCTANGKALLATMPPERVKALLPSRLPRFTPHTIATRAKLMRQLEQVRSDGVAFDREEYTEGVCAASAAVSDGTGATAAISVPVPAQRFAGRERELAAAVREAAARATSLFDRE
jgi:DNA-binding IclR family transcriptional regulator